MDQGWVKLHRKILSNRFLQFDDKSFIVFVKLLLLVDKNTGEYATGRIQFGKMLDMNPRTLYGVLHRLESQQMIEISANNKYSTYRISKWEDYQDSGNNAATTTQQPRNNAATTTQHSNKNKELRIENSTNVLMNLDKSSSSKVTSKEYFGQLVAALGYSDTTRATDGRIAKMKKRLTNFSTGEMLQAARNLGQDEYMQGDNDASKRWGNIDYFLRSDEIVDKWLQADAGSTHSSGGKIDESKYV